MNTIRRILFCPCRYLYAVYNYRQTVWLMTKRNFTARFTGTLVGGVWEVVNPLVMIMVYWTVFTLGFKAQGFSGVSFTLYFLCGMLPWVMFSEVVGACPNSISDNSRLIKNTNFPSEVLPFVYLISGTISHVILIVLTIIVVYLHGQSIGREILLLLYYFLLMCIYLVGISWLTAALNVYIRDVGKGVTLILNVWFWLTPIVWNKDMIPVSLQWLLFANPMYYVVEGYRIALLDYQGPEPFGSATLTIWLIALLVLVLGSVLFSRLKVTFADAL